MRGIAHNSTAHPLSNSSSASCHITLPLLTLIDFDTPLPIVKLDLFFPTLPGPLSDDEQESESEIFELANGSDIDSDIDILGRLLEDEDQLSDSSQESFESDHSSREGFRGPQRDRFGVDWQITRLRHYVKKSLKYQAWVIAYWLKLFRAEGRIIELGETPLSVAIDDRCDRVNEKINKALVLFPDQLKDDLSAEFTELVETTRDRFVAELHDVLEETHTIYEPSEHLSERFDTDREPRPIPVLVEIEDEVVDENIAQEEPGSQNRDQRWNHITISRDQTRASNFSEQLLLILRTSKFERSKENVLARLDAGSDHLRAPPTRAIYPNLVPFTYSRDRIRGEAPFSMSKHEHTSTRSIPASGSRLGYLPENMVDGARSQGERSSQQPFQTVEPRLARSNTLDELRGRISSLEVENQSLKVLQGSEIRHETVYLIQQDPGREALAYLDEPTWALGPRGEVSLKALFPIPDVRGWLEQRTCVAFSVGKYYEPKEQEADVQKAVRDKKGLPPPKPTSESIRLESQDMKEAMEALFTNNSSLKQKEPNFNSNEPIPAPYLFWYHDRSPDALAGIVEHHCKLLTVLTNWIDKNYGTMYARVDTQLKRGVVSYESMTFLIQPGDGVVLNSKPGKDDGVLQGRIAEGSPTSATPKSLVNDSHSSPWKKKVRDGKKPHSWKWFLPVWQYSYDGSFYRNRGILYIELEVEEPDEEVEIRKLNIYPLRHASEQTKALLAQRGRTVWSCRNQCLIAYEDPTGVYGVSPGKGPQRQSLTFPAEWREIHGRLPYIPTTAFRYMELQTAVQFNRQSECAENGSQHC